MKGNASVGWFRFLRLGARTSRSETNASNQEAARPSPCRSQMCWCAASTGSGHESKRTGLQHAVCAIMHVAQQPLGQMLQAPGTTEHAPVTWGFTAWNQTQTCRVVLNITHLRKLCIHMPCKPESADPSGRRHVRALVVFSLSQLLRKYTYMLAHAPSRTAD